MACVSHQRLLIHKHDMASQSEREGARATEDKAATKERTEDAQAVAEAVQKNAKGNAPVEIKETTCNRDKNRLMSTKGK